MIKKIVKQFSEKARKKRAAIFQTSFKIDKQTKILDLGSENGKNINNVLKNATVNNRNIYIADINQKFIIQGQTKFGYNPVLIDPSGIIPFDNNFFDIVFCSSVIEHVTILKREIWTSFSGNKFKNESYKRQKEFALEIERVGKQYFVQTPYKYFPIESHTWLPLIAFIPRWLLIPILWVTNIFWVKKTTPDWNLLKKNEMKELFPNAQIVYEKMFGLTKSIMAINKK